ncbi:MAG: phage late control D family protein [Caulobacteraceae bacterium]|nr:MAG: phage late control D family protein [Caulobacteraceae bacterium]
MDTQPGPGLRRPDEVRLVLKDNDGQLAIPPAGASIRVKIGWLDTAPGSTPQLIDKGTFKVQDREHGGPLDQLSLTARSDNVSGGFRTRRTQTWRDTTLGAVLQEVASRNSLQARIWPEMAQKTIRTLTQRQESDSAFLTRLGRLHDAIATTKNDTLLFGPAGTGETAGGDPIPTFTITRSSGDKHTWKASERDKTSGVTAEYQDRAGGQRRSVTVGSASNAKKLGRVYGSEQTARKAAQAAMSKADRKGATFNMTLAEGRPDLCAGQKITVVGFKPEIDATGWLIKEVSHTIDGSGLRTAIQCELGSAAS